MSEIAIQAIFLHKLITIKPVARIQMDSQSEITAR